MNMGRTVTGRQARVDTLARADARRAQRFGVRVGTARRTNGHIPLARANQRSRARTGGAVDYLSATGAPPRRSAGRSGPPAPRPAQGLLTSAFLIALGVAGLLLLRSDLVFAASTALVAGLI